MYTGKTFDTITQVEAIMNYGEAISNDYQRWTIASAILETAERFTAQENEPALQEFQLVVGGMKALAENRYDSSLILDAFSLRCGLSSEILDIKCHVLTHATFTAEVMVM